MKKKFLGIICLIYSGIIFYVWFSGNIKNFLAPQMQIYLEISGFFFLIMGTIIIFSKKSNYQLELNDFILFLPVIFLILAGDGRLNASFASNRANSFSNKQVVNKNTNENENTKEEIKEENEIKKEDYNFKNVDFNVIDESYEELANYMDYVPYSNIFHGKTIRVRGFVVKDAPNIPNGYFSLGKYTITCCVADAAFLGFIVKEGNFTIEENKWYEIEGVLDANPDKNSEIITIIRVVNIKEIDGKKEEQYVYSCYAYDNGSCKEISKYDLKYDE